MARAFEYARVSGREQNLKSVNRIYAGNDRIALHIFETKKWKAGKKAM